MKRPIIIAGGALALATASVMASPSFAPVAAQASESSARRGQTVTFTVANMTCATCPITVKKAMAGVEGVRSVEIDFDAKTATVAFDPRIANAAAIAAASTNAGYPAARAS